jgi:hypothetical protein
MVAPRKKMLSSGQKEPVGAGGFRLCQGYGAIRITEQIVGWLWRARPKDETGENPKEGGLEPQSMTPGCAKSR